MKLSVVLGTYNRLEQLRRCIDSIVRETSCPFTIYVTDAGSNDGTIDYLESISSEYVKPVLVGKKLGQAKAYNEVFSIVETPYVCWLSDDNQVVNKGLDIAVSILETNPEIGLVGLKTKDKKGPFISAPYIGGMSKAGILNVNQGMLPTKVIKKVGGFSDEFRDYGIDPALTAEVLFAGYKIVYTKKVALYHYRNWSEDPASENYKWIDERNKAAQLLYERKYCLENSNNKKNYPYRKLLLDCLKKILVHDRIGKKMSSYSITRTCINILSGKYISIFDTFLSIGKKYHLSQKK